MSYTRKREDIRRMRKISTAQQRASFYKKLCNRRVRHDPDITSGSSYKKISEFFWELY